MGMGSMFKKKTKIKASEDDWQRGGWFQWYWLPTSCSLECQVFIVFGWRCNCWWGRRSHSRWCLCFGRILGSFFFVGGGGPGFSQQRNRGGYLVRGECDNLSGHRWKWAWKWCFKQKESTSVGGLIWSTDDDWGYPGITSVIHFCSAIYMVYSPWNSHFRP